MTCTFLGVGTTSERDTEKRRAKAALAAAQKAEAGLQREKKRLVHLERKQQAQPPPSPGGSYTGNLSDCL